MEQVFSQRLKSARIMKGYSMDVLCEQMGNSVSKQSISKYETGKMMPDSTVLIALSNALSVSIDYFFRPYQYELINIEFRKKSRLKINYTNSLKEQVRDAVERYFEIENILNIDHEFKLDISGLIIKTEADVKLQAALLRAMLKCGEDGISSVVAVLEEHNIKVIEIDAVADFDGLSGYINERYPIIVLNKHFTAERLRFTALHELGHLLLRFDQALSAKAVEHYCNLFANELLLSSSQFVKQIGTCRKDISLHELIPIQRQFGISIDAMMYKAKEMGIISEQRYKGYCIKKNQVPDFKHQVGESRYPTEQSDRFVAMVFRAISDQIITLSKAAALLGKSVDEVQMELDFI